jgi:excisionase family DNA binding protein
MIGLLTSTHGLTNMTLIESIAARKTAYKIEELADILNCSDWKLYQMVKGGRIPHFKLGSMIRFDPKLIANWLEERTVDTRTSKGRARKIV